MSAAGIVNFLRKTIRLCSHKKAIHHFLLSRPLYFRHLSPVSFPHEEGVYQRFFINLTMPEHTTGERVQRLPTIGYLP
jgi:hypothetical protein